MEFNERIIIILSSSSFYKKRCMKCICNHTTNIAYVRYLKQEETQTIKQHLNSRAGIISAENKSVFKCSLS